MFPPDNAQFVLINMPWNEAFRWDLGLNCVYFGFLAPFGNAYFSLGRYRWQQVGIMPWGQALFKLHSNKKILLRKKQRQNCPFLICCTRRTRIWRTKNVVRIYMKQNKVYNTPFPNQASELSNTHNDEYWQNELTSAHITPTYCYMSAQ